MVAARAPERLDIFASAVVTLPERVLKVLVLFVLFVLFVLLGFVLLILLLRVLILPESV